MIQEAWHNDPLKRPNFAREAIIIRIELNNMTDMIVYRTLHMLDRSRHEYVGYMKSM